MPVKKAIFDKKNILIVGGAGFIGSHLCDELVKSNKIICIDNFITGDNMNIAHLLQNPDFRFINHNIIDPINLETFEELEYFKIPFQGIQEIYFLASPTSPMAYNKYPIETLLVNSIGLRNVLDMAVKYESKVLFASSPAVYGTGTGTMLVKEDYVGMVDQLGPRACFAEAKRFGETLAFNYHLEQGLQTKIARIFNCYGPRMSLSDGRMIPELIRMAVEKQDLIIYGKENEFGSYFYISDLIRSLIKFMNSDEVGPMNFASEWKSSFKEIAEKIIQINNVSSKLIFLDKNENYDYQPLADISLAKENLGWFPVILLEEGLKNTIDYLSAQEGIRRPEQVA
jgi:nucleoside-diphosphate-sugar epimerase